MARNATPKGIFFLTTSILLGGLPPATIQADPVRSARAQEHQVTARWYVVTRAFVLKQAADEMHQRLIGAGLHPKRLTREETVRLYAFDDSRTFRQRRQAEQAKQEWNNHGLETAIMADEHGFRISLGRYYIAGYAREFRNRLEATSMPFSVESRETLIPVYRFIFQSHSREEAEQYWKALQKVGATDPMIIDLETMLTMFGDKAERIFPASISRNLREPNPENGQKGNRRREDQGLPPDDTARRKSGDFSP